MDLILVLLIYFSNYTKELHLNNASDIKTEAEMSLLSVKYDLEMQLKDQKVGNVCFTKNNLSVSIYSYPKEISIVIESSNHSLIYILILKI